MMAVALVLNPAPGAGFLVRLAAWLRGLVSRRLFLRLAGVETVVLEGRVLAVRAVPLGVAKRLVPAILRCSRRFAAWEVDESLYDDMVQVLSLGLGVPARDIEALTVPLWDLVPVFERIGRVNGMTSVEAGRADLGKLLAAVLTQSTGTSSTASSSPLPAGPGSTSTSD